MITYLYYGDLLTKLTPFGIKSIASINRLIREQGLPCMALTPRKRFFEESQIDVWISRHFLNVAENKTKVAKRNKKRNKTAGNGVATPITALSPFRAQEA